VTLGISRNAMVSMRTGKPKDAVAKSLLALAALLSMASYRLPIGKPQDPLTVLSSLPRAFAKEIMRHNPLWNFDTYIEIEKRFNATSSFYFLANQTTEDSDYDFQSPLLREEMLRLSKEGCEVGLHTSFYSFANQNKIASEKALLEEALGGEVVGVTQHYVRCKIPETWRYLETAGIIYDASFGYAQEVGFRSGTCLPFRLRDFKSKRTLSLLEIPFVVMDGTLFQKRYLNLSFGEALEICKELIDVTHRYNGCFTIQWHSSLDREMERFWLDLYEKILEYASQFDTWFTDGKKLASWWNLRSLILLKSEFLSESRMALSIDSPAHCEDFTLAVHIPKGFADATLFVNAQRLQPGNLVRNGDVLSFFFDIEKGENRVEILLQQKHH
jgi:hypothetical protein